MVFENTTYLFAFVNKFHYWKKGKEYEGVVGGLHLKVHYNIHEANE